MRHSEGNEFTSFDMILDIMCNAFGGMVFIALMLTILSQAIDVKHAENVDFTSSGLGRDKLEQDEEGRIVKQENKDSKSDEKERFQKEIMSNQLEIVERNGRITALEKEVHDLQKEVERLQTPTQRHLRYPRLHAIDKAPVFIALKDNRLYPISSLTSPFIAGRSRGYDLSHVQRWEEEHRTLIDPVPGKGERVEPGGEHRGLLKAALTRIDPDNEYLSFAVFPDSFDGFLQLKNIFLEHGFDYNWLIVRDRLSIVRVTGKGAPQHAQ